MGRKVDDGTAGGNRCTIMLEQRCSGNDHSRVATGLVVCWGRGSRHPAGAHLIAQVDLLLIGRLWLGVRMHGTLVETRECTVYIHLLQSPKTIPCMRPPHRHCSEGQPTGLRFRCRRRIGRGEYEPARLAWGKAFSQTEGCLRMTSINARIIHKLSFKSKIEMCINGKALNRRRCRRRSVHRYV